MRGSRYTVRTTQVVAALLLADDGELEDLVGLLNDRVATKLHTLLADRAARRRHPDLYAGRVITYLDQSWSLAEGVIESVQEESITLTSGEQISKSDIYDNATGTTTPKEHRNV